MSSITYKQITSYFKSIADHHEQISSYGIGDFKQLTMDIETQQEPKYTRMYVIPETVEFNQNHIHYNFAIVIMDKVEDDLSNLQEVMSDTLEIAQDIWTVFWQSYQQQYGNFSEIIVGDWEPDTHPFTERFETILGGWTMHIKLSAPFDYNSCDLPIYPFNFPQDESFSAYKQILADWEQFSIAHKQIRSWGFGDPTQLTMNVQTKQEPEYPRLYFIPDRTRFNPNHMHITWTVIVCDKIWDDYSNQEEVLSDCLEIAKDFYAKAYLSDYDVEWDAVLNPWLEETETTLAGWSFTISVQQKFDYNRCVLPMLSFLEPSPTPTPSVTPTPTPTPTPEPTGLTIQVIVTGTSDNSYTKSWLNFGYALSNTQVGGYVGEAFSTSYNTSGNTFFIDSGVQQVNIPKYGNVWWIFDDGSCQSDVVGVRTIYADIYINNIYQGSTSGNTLPTNLCPNHSQDGVYSIGSVFINPGDFIKIISHQTFNNVAPTPTPSITQTITPTPSVTPTLTTTPTPSVTPYLTTTPTPSITPTITQSPTIPTKLTWSQIFKKWMENGDKWNQ